MNKQKFSKKLSEIEKITLTEFNNNYHNARSRKRAHYILLSARGYTIGQIADIYEIDRDRVSHYIDAWETIGIIGLLDESRGGRPPKFNKQEQEEIIKEFTKEPRSIKRAQGFVKEKHGKDVSAGTLKGWLKNLGYSYRRVKASLKSKQNKEAVTQARATIQDYKQQELAGKIRLTYFDASGFSLVPHMCYAWQKIHQTIELLAQRSKRINVLGFMDSNGNTTSFTIEGKVDSAVVISVFDDFANDLTIPTVVVLDNASIHTSAAFKNKIHEWQAKGLTLYYLPPYSPELNKIEILWRFIKYQWLDFSAYLSFDNLKKELDLVLQNIGSKYQITFS